MKWIIIIFILVCGIMPLASADYEVIMSEDANITCGALFDCTGEFWINVTTKKHNFKKVKLEKEQWIENGKEKDIKSNLTLWRYNPQVDIWVMHDQTENTVLEQGVHHFVVNGTKDGKSHLKWSIPAMNIDPYWYGLPVGWEEIDGWTIHLWNTEDDYYINSTSDLQMSNHWDQIWSTNYHSIEVENSSGTYTYDLIDYNISWIPETDNVTFVNYTGNIIVGEINLTMHYSLPANQSYIDLYPTFENLGNENATIRFIWKTTDIKVANETFGNLAFIDDVAFNLSEDLGMSLGDFNTKEVVMAENDTDEWMKFHWYEDDYIVQINSTPTQNHAPITLIINVGEIAPSSSETIHLGWIDALCSWTCIHSYPTSQVDILVGNTYESNATITFSGKCLTGNSFTAQYNDTFDGTWNDVKDEADGTNLTVPLYPGDNPDSTSCSPLTGCGYAEWTIQGIKDNQDDGPYQVRTKCVFHLSQTKYSTPANGYINVSTPPEPECENLIDITSSVTLTANNNSCFNVTGDDIIFNCDGYEIYNNHPHGYWAIQAHNSENFTLRDCTIKNWSQGLLINNISTSLVDNVTFDTIRDDFSGDISAIAIFLNHSNYSQFINSEITNVTSFNTLELGDCWELLVYGLHLDESDDTIIENVTFGYTNGSGIVDQDPDIPGCQSAYRNVGYGTYASASENLTYINNTVDYAEYYGIFNTQGGNYTIKESSFLASGISSTLWTGTMENVLFINNYINSSDSKVIAIGSATFGDVNISNNSFNNVEGLCIGTIASSNNLDVHKNIGHNIGGLVYSQSANTRIYNNTVDGGGTTSIVRTTGASPEVYDNYFYNLNATADGVPTFYFWSTGTYYNNHVENFSEGYIFVTNNIVINDSTLRGTVEYNDIESLGVGHNLYNVTFNYSNVVMLSGDIDVYHYLKVNVTNSGGDPLIADVNVTNSTGDGTPEIETQTDATGLTDWLTIKYINYSTTGLTNHSFHNVSAFNASYTENYNSIRMNRSFITDIILSSAQCWIYNAGAKLLRMPPGCLFGTDDIYKV